MAPFEKVYGFSYQTSLFWNETGKHKVLDPTYCKKPRSKFVWLGKPVSCAIKTEELCRPKVKRIKF
jgi:hypothetical protein